MNKEETPLLPPTPYPMYPFREDRTDFIEGIGDYLLSGEDYIALRNTVGYPPQKSKLKVFLIRKCNVSDPVDYSFPDITETLRSYLEENANNTPNEQKQQDDLITLSVATKNILSAEELYSVQLMITASNLSGLSMLLQTHHIK